MHLPSESLQGAICPVTAAVAIAGITVAALVLARQEGRPSFRHFVLTTMAILSLQAVNYPLPGGFSGHMLGAVLAVALLGLPAGILSMATVITTQCLLFADGGRMELGANVLNMAVIASLPGMLLHGAPQSLSRLFAASLSSVLVAVLAVGIELLIGGAAASGRQGLFQVLLLYHLPIALIEGLATTAIVLTLHIAPLRIGAYRSVALAVLTAIAVVMLPFASSAPDALETILGVS